MLPLGAGTVPRDDVPRFLMIAPRAWRAITRRQWAWTTAIALLLFVAHVVGVLPAVLYAPNPIGPAQIGWGMAKFAGLMVAYLVVAYCFLLTISIAEYGAAPPAPMVGRSIAAGLGACGAAILLGF